MHHRLKDPQGFSVIELVVAIVLMGLLAAMVMPSFASTIQRDHVERAANRVVSDINFARMLAIRGGEGVQVRFVGDDRYEIWLESNTDDPQRTTTFGDGYGETTVAGTDLRFNSRGMLTSAGLQDDTCPQITLEGRDRNQVVLSLTGAGRVIDGGCPQL